MTTKIEAVFESGERIVSMIQFKNYVMLATERRVYKMREDPLTGTVAFDPVVIYEVKE